MTKYPFTYKYYYMGETYYVVVHASSLEEAEGRLRAMYDGVLSEPPVTTLYQRLYWGLRYALTGRPRGA